MNQLPEKSKVLFRVVSFLTVVVLVAALAWLSRSDPDPCANPQSNVSAAVLGEESDDQDALVNRALIVKGECDSKSK